MRGVIYAIVALLTVLAALLGWWLYDEAWIRGYEFGYSAGLLADDKLDITLEEWK